MTNFTDEITKDERRTLDDVNNGTDYYKLNTFERVLFVGKHGFDNVSIRCRRKKQENPSSSNKNNFDYFLKIDNRNGLYERATRAFSYAHPTIFTMYKLFGRHILSISSIIIAVLALVLK